MKTLLFAVLTIIALQAAAAFKECPDKIPKGAPTAPKAGTYYQLQKAAKKKEDVANVAGCYNLNISGSGKKLTIEQSMLVNDIPLKNIYVAEANVNGTWDVTMNGMPSSRVYITSIATNILGILSCEQKSALTIQTGIYSTGKTLSKADAATIKAALAKFKITEKQIEDVDRSKCKN